MSYVPDPAAQGGPGGPWAPAAAPVADRPPGDRSGSSRRSSALSLAAAGAGLLVLVFSFFPWITPRLSLSNQVRDGLDPSQQRIAQQAIDKLGSVWASAWDLKYAPVAVIFAVVASLLALAPRLDRRVRPNSPLPLGASVLALVLAVVQLIHRAGILGRLIDAVRSSIDESVPGSTSDFGSLRIGLAWAAWLCGGLIVVQRVLLALAWRGGQEPGPAGAPGGAGDAYQSAPEGSWGYGSPASQAAPSQSPEWRGDQAPWAAPAAQEWSSPYPGDRPNQYPPNSQG